MPNAIASPPTIVSPGYFTSIRKPSLKSSDSPPSQARPRPSRSSSLCCVTPPNAASARRRASSGDRPLLAHEPLGLHLDVETRTLRSIRDSAARGAEEEMRSARARVHVMKPAHCQVLRSTASRPAAKRFQLSSSCPSARRPAAVEPIVARAAVVVGRPPVAGDQAVLLEALQRRIERALVHLENSLRHLLDALADPPAVHRGRATAS